MMQELWTNLIHNIFIGWMRVLQIQFIQVILHTTKYKTNAEKYENKTENTEK